MNQKTQEEVKNLETLSIQFHDAIFNKKINEDTLISILSTTSNLDRQIIRLFYRKKYSNPIQTDIQMQLSSDLRDLVLDMFDLPYEYDARELHRALTSLKTDVKTINEIIITRPSMAILASSRPKNQTLEINQAYDIAKSLIKNGIKQYGKNVNLFREVFIDKSRLDLILISRAFYDLYKKNLYDTISKEVSGKNKKLIKDILFGIITPAQWFAKKAYKAMKGPGTDDNTLFRVIISRAEIDMDEIREYYFRDWNTDLRNDIDGDCSGAYGKILMNLSEK